MTIDLKQPKYILPLIALPFLCLFFYVYHSSAKDKKTVQHLAGINSNVGDVSPGIKKKELSDKLDAFRNKYKESDGKTAVSVIPSEEVPAPQVNQQQTLDSINRVMQKRFSNPPVRSREQVMRAALKHFQTPPEPAPPKARDPMDLFKQQMAYMDSIRKASDPTYMAEKQKQEAKAKLQQSNEKILQVIKIPPEAADFNTIIPKEKEDFITATIDENVTGYAGSRIALKLNTDVKAGQQTVPKGTELYALINGFSGQRVTLQIRSILYNGQLLPVKMDVYDQDGLLGLYVPNSQFRDFTRDLGGSSIQGVSLDNGSASGILMSTAGKLFESASSAVASAIRKNKAKIKYNTYVYLIQTQ
ncbi:MAG: conjugative transposon protein TraM [Sphingobacteriales bacterium]